MTAYREARRQAEESGVWPDPRTHGDCIECPFWHDPWESQEDTRFGGCAVNGSTWRPFTEDEDSLDGPPEWCPLRVGAILVKLVEESDGS